MHQGPLGIIHIPGWKTRPKGTLKGTTTSSEVKYSMLPLFLRVYWTSWTNFLFNRRKRRRQRTSRANDSVLWGFLVSRQPASRLLAWTWKRLSNGVWNGFALAWLFLFFISFFSFPLPAPTAVSGISLGVFSGIHDLGLEFSKISISYRQNGNNRPNVFLACHFSFFCLFV